MLVSYLLYRLLVLCRNVFSIIQELNLQISSSLHIFCYLHLSGYRMR